MEEHRNSLQPGYRLHWYVIKKILGQGGFGITYLAEDTNLNQLVAIKEYLPVELAVREGDHSIHPLSGEYGEQFHWGLDRFMSEARTLAQFKHPNIVRVFAVFPENNSAYMVMEYESGRAMHELLKQHKTLGEEELKQIFLPILDGLEQVHQAGFIHRDIKPPNIFIREDGSPVLLDFGSARQSLGEKTRTLTSMVSPGFAPFEQYVSKSDKQGPWTDIYGLAATMYRAVVGRTPAEAMDRSEALLHTQRDIFVGASEIAPAGYSDALLRAIDSGLAFKVEDRPQSINEWREQLSGATPARAAAATFRMTEPGSPETQQSEAATEKITIIADVEEAPPSRQEKKKPWYKKPLKLIAVVFGILLLLAILDDNKKKQQLAETESAADSPAIMLDSTAPSEIESPPAGEPAGNDTAGNSGAANPDSEPETGSGSVAASPQALPSKPADELIEASDRRLLERVKRQLERDPDSKRARQSLRKLTDKYEGRLKQAINDKDFELAEAYVDAMLKHSPQSKKLQDLAKKIRDRKSE